MNTGLIILIVICCILSIIGIVLGVVFFNKAKVTSEEAAKQDKLTSDKQTDVKIAAIKANTTLSQTEILVQITKINADKIASDKIVSDRLKQEQVDKAANDKATSDKIDQLKQDSTLSSADLLTKITQLNADKAVSDKAISDRYESQRLEKLTSDKDTSDKIQSIVSNNKLSSDQILSQISQINSDKANSDKIINDKYEKERSDRLTSDKLFADKYESQRLEKIASDKATSDKIDKLKQDSTLSNSDLSTKISQINADKAVSDKAIADKYESQRLEKIASDKDVSDQIALLTRNIYELKSSSDPCAGYIDGSVGISDACLDRLWKDSKCTTPITFSDRGQAKWKGMSLKDIKTDMYAWSNNKDAVAIKGCYGVTYELLAGNYITDTLTSKNGIFALVMQSDGNLVIYKKGGSAVWSTKTSGSNRTRLTSVGNLEIRVSGGLESLVWQSGSSGTGSKLVVSDEGNAVIYDQSNNVVWSSDIVASTTGGVIVPVVANSITISSCDGPVSLVCPANNVIISGTITYGRWEQGTCSGTVPNPVIKKTYPLKSGIGLNKYTIPGDLRTECGEDPAPNIYKQYIITFVYGPETTQRTYQTISNIDYGGQGDLIVQAGTLDQVRAKCDATSGCNGFFYDGTNGFLKNITPGTGVQNINGNGSYYYTGIAPKLSKTEITAGNRLVYNDILKSANGVFSLVMQGDGNLVLYNKTTSIWSIGTKAINQGLLLTVQGNLQIIDSNGFDVLWQSGSSGTGTKLVVSNDGNIVLTDQNGNVKWTRFTYLGDNGAVDGNRYCAGPWGNGAIDKNKKCANGYAIDTSSTGKFKEGQMVGCGDVLEMGNFGFQCI
jgi:hypothetical protein